VQWAPKSKNTQKPRTETQKNGRGVFGARAENGWDDSISNFVCNFSGCCMGGVVGYVPDTDVYP